VRRNLVIAAAGGLAAVGWLVASSYIALQLGHIPTEALPRPWLAWWTYAANHPDRWTKIILITAAIPPTGVVALLIALGWKIADRLWFKPSRQQELKATPLYGNSDWAGRRDMHAGSIKSSKSAF